LLSVIIVWKNFFLKTIGFTVAAMPATKAMGGTVFPATRP
jgi:hypothetical protein